MEGRRTDIVAHVAPYYFQGEDAYLTFEHRVSGTLTDATAAPTITIEDAMGATSVSAANTTTTGTTGCYYYEWVIASTAVCGIWQWQLSATYDTKTNLGCHGTVEVKRKIG